ncbi:hypothetical protein Cflav_PD2079 [Pedosphaera parvula Ellin514]|uniref:Uncharacterized protein n=1 Tax=Pedosphaera parvula (strain Ellin514) TaxID=320771 RepID=B9XLI0_PEDPL|nr:hypothetical protein Cflav_PD2079 [Pedosphaera parvula Ellin514]
MGWRVSAVRDYLRLLGEKFDPAHLLMLRGLIAGAEDCIVGRVRELRWRDGLESWAVSVRRGRDTAALPGRTSLAVGLYRRSRERWG